MNKLVELYPCIRSVEDKAYTVRILNGIEDYAVAEREIVNVYQVNRTIKHISDYHLLKAISPGVGIIHDWRKQIELLCTFLGIGKSTLYNRLNKLVDLKLATVDDNIKLVGFKEAAAIFNIPYQGLQTIQYNPLKNAGKQDFQYILRGAEVHNNQEDQLDALVYKLGKNLSVKNILFVELAKQGADMQRLHKDPHYLAQQLLQLYTRSFKEGTEICSYIIEYRADLNRGVKGIQKNHCYKSAQSVSYMKRRMSELGVVTIEKKRVESKERSRLYIPDGEKRRDGYKYNSITKRTVWFLCDQICFKYESKKQKTQPGKAANAA
jgi:hypothetical protein